MRSKQSSELMQQLVFVGPAMIFFCAIVLIPFLMGIGYSFTSWNGVSDVKTWVGFDNYVQAFTDEKFLKAFEFTTLFSIASVILTNVFGFGLALCLSQALKAKNLYRTIFFMPNVIGGLLLGYIWYFIFNVGFVMIGKLTGIEFLETSWLGEPDKAYWATVIVQVWKQSGYLMVIYIAAIANVPTDLIEAAKIDGASAGRILRTIIIPMIMPAVTIGLFLSISDAFKFFDLNLALTKGGPFGSTNGLSLDIYTEAFTSNRLGLGSAKAVIFFIAVAIITIVQVSITKKKEVEA